MQAWRSAPDRRKVALAFAGAAFFLWSLAAVAAASIPALLRIKAATVSTPELAATEKLYRDRLDHRVRERGVVTRALARSWGAPASAGRRYVLLSTDAAPDVFLRLIEAPRDTPPKPLSTLGWSAIEIIVDDPDRLFAELRDSPFRVIGEPAPLGSYPSIRAFQVVGPAAEVLYLTSETGDRSKSILPLPNGRVGRVFIMVLAASNARATLDWYARAFTLTPGPLRTRPNPMLNEALGLAPGTALPIATARLANHGNLIQVDGYPAQADPRPARRGQLPAVVAMTTFTVRNLDELALAWLSRPAVRPGGLYAGRRAATVRGPDGELIELVEETASD
ncbi:MAG: hypothetical protein KJS95_12900 [Gammaproteobacteria bacterium]|nr:hypothetical protein [Gammaproteobacteria bacterium]